MAEECRSAGWGARRLPAVTAALALGAIMAAVTAHPTLAQKRASAAAAARQGCADGETARPFLLTGYNANITTAPKATKVRPGQLVEFNAEARHDHSGYLQRVAKRGALPEWYWIGANCNKGPDCDGLAASGVKLGSTGTAEWNKTEARIEDLRHGAVVARAEAEMERALRMAARAGTDLAFRIDNMHELDDVRFYDRRHVRKPGELEVLTDAWDRVVKRLRAERVLAERAIVGLTGHNNFAFWKRLIEAGGTPPLLLRHENPTQFGPELEIGIGLMQKYRLPLIAVEFREGHLYKPTEAAIRSVAGRVSLLVLMESEDNYESGTLLPGPGPKAITGPGCRG